MAKTEVKSLRAKLVKIAHGLGTVPKSKRNPHFGYNYVSEGQLIALLGPKLAEQNIMFTTSVLTCQPQYGEGKEGVFVMVTVECVFFDCDTNEELKVLGAGMGWDSTDKGVYKAITGAVKYVLMKNFWVTDEQDPEAGEQAPAATTATSHRPTREYEREGERGEDKKGKELTDLMQLSTWMQDHHVPESFVLAMLVEKKLVNANVKKLANVQPGILRRLLNPASLDRLKAAWENSKVPSNDGKKEVRTREGDQTRPELRVFCKAKDISADDYLEQEGVSDWRQVKVPSGKHRGTPLGKLSVTSLRWYLENWKAEYRGKISKVAMLFDAALWVAQAELIQAEADLGGSYS